MRLYTRIVMVIMGTWLAVTLMTSVGFYFDLTPDFITENLITKSYIGLLGFLYISLFLFAGFSIIIMVHTQKDID